MALSKFRTPDSIVYPVMISLIFSSLKLIWSELIPFWLVCRGSRYFLEIYIFSATLYPLMSMISIRSSRAGWMLSKLFAVAINIILLRSYGVARK